MTMPAIAPPESAADELSDAPDPPLDEPFDPVVTDETPTLPPASDTVDAFDVIVDTKLLRRVFNAVLVGAVLARVTEVTVCCAAGALLRRSWVGQRTKGSCVF